MAKIPKDERVWVTYKNKRGEVRYLITSKQARDVYFLYEQIDGDLKRLWKSPSPEALLEKFEVMKHIPD